MSDRRRVTSDQASCPTCGCDTAIVRVRGNAFAATCTGCRASTITPMLCGDELVDALGEGPVVQPVQLAYARMRRLGRVDVGEQGWNAFGPPLPAGALGVTLRVPTL